jgi:RNA polymerase sigma-70 factor (ECF subfamily)
MFFLFTTSNVDETDNEINGYDYIINLYEKYGKTLWKYAFQLSKSNEIASDLVSTTYLIAIEKIEIINKIHRYKIKSYLISMVKNTYINYINKEKSVVDIDNISEYSYCNSNEDFTEKVGISEVEEALNHLPEPYRSILIYRYVYDEFSYEEIAIALDINVKNIRVYKKRALDMLKQRLKGGETSHE